MAINPSSAISDSEIAKLYLGDATVQVVDVDGQEIIYSPGKSQASTRANISIVTTVARDLNDAITRLIGAGPIEIPPESANQSALEAQ